MRSDPVLRRYFRLFNRRYFGNQLPDETEIRWRTRADLKGHGLNKEDLATTLTGNGDPPLIVLSPFLRRHKMGSLIKFTILHEMVHVKTNNRDSHGPVWENEMRRLALAGAFKKRGKTAPLW